MHFLDLRSKKNLRDLITVEIAILFRDRDRLVLMHSKASNVLKLIKAFLSVICSTLKDC